MSAAGPPRACRGRGAVGRRLRRALLAWSAALLVGAAAAQEGSWAVQVVALRDYREAQAASAQLAALGFPSYLEFAMHDGLQFVRVRVGCFTTREAAEAMAAAMRGRVTADAQPVELTPGAAVRGCTEESVGFLNGYDWEIVDDGGPVAFGVSVAGVPVTVVHDGERWQMVQQGEEAPGLSPAAGTGVITERHLGGAAFAVLEEDGAGTVICPGTVLAHVGGVAIVERGDVVLACRWLPGAGA